LNIKFKEILKKYDHIWLLLYIPIYVFFFNVLETWISPESNYWVSYMPLDDLIPFNELYVIPYVIWFPYMFLMGGYLFFMDKDAFIRYIWGYIIGFSTALICFALFPNGQDLRPEVFPRDNFLVDMVKDLYANDTNTNVLPSMHVIGAWLIFFVYLDCEKLKKWWHISYAFIIAVLTTLSTVYIKQHSLLDVIWGVIWCIPIYFITQVWMKRRMERKAKEKTQKSSEAELTV
jgi:membrane-associated phospholipid phosphatase